MTTPGQAAHEAAKRVLVEQGHYANHAYQGSNEYFDSSVGAWCCGRCGQTRGGHSLDMVPWKELPWERQAYFAAIEQGAPSRPSDEFTIRSLQKIIARGSRLRAEQEQSYRAVVEAARGLAEGWTGPTADCEEMDRLCVALAAALDGCGVMGEVKDDE